jgi:DNA-binding IclR family transcriptional regulator
MISSVLLNKEVRPDYQVSSVRKALEILCVFTPDNPRWTLSGLSRKLGIPKSTASNLTRTLQAFDLLRQDAQDKTYFIGPRAHELGLLYTAKTDLIGCALPRMRRLNDLTKETVKLGVLSQREVLVVAAIESPLQLHTRGDVGRRWHLHSSSLGKAILSALPQNEVEEIIEAGLPRFTEATLTNPADLVKALRQIREKGYALDLEENEPGVRCVSASVTDPIRGLTAAVSMSGPTVRLGSETLLSHARHVIAAARQIQAALREARQAPGVVRSVKRH